MEVHVNADGFPEAPAELLAAAVRRTLREAGQEAASAVAELSLTLLGDEDIRRLNRTYLDRDRPTDVIAFALGGGSGGGGADEGTLGDVYIGFERAVEQARAHGVTLREELVRLAVHGTLHVLGHDHPEGEDRARSPMFALQERIVDEVVDAS